MKKSVTTVVRKGWLAVWLACITMAVVSCSGGASDARSKLQAAVTDMQSKLPMDLGVTGEMSAVSFDDSTLTIHFKMAMPIDVDVLKQNEELTKLSIITNYCLMEEEQMKLVELVTEAGVTLKLEIEGQSDELATFSFPANEMEAMLGSETDESKLAYQYLTAQAELTQMQTPMVVDGVTTLKDVTLENMRFLFSYEVNDSVVDMDALEQNKDAMRQNILMTSSSDPVTGMLKQRCDQAGVKLTYRYVGKKSGKELEIEL